MIDIRQLNVFVKTNRNFYELIKEKRQLYLPDLISAYINQGCLLQLAKREVFSIPYSQVKWLVRTPMQKKTRAELVDILSSLSSKPLGFDADHAPNKEWLLNCIHSLRPNHEIFAKPEEEIIRVVPAE